MLTDDELAAIAARADRATPGPWLHGFGCVIFAYPFPPASPAGAFVAAPRGAIVGGYLPDWQAAPTAAFIASARDDVPALVAEVRHLRAQRDMARTELAELRERIRERDGHRRDAVAALCEALGLPPR